VASSRGSRDWIEVFTGLTVRATVSAEQFAISFEATFWYTEELTLIDGGKGMKKGIHPEFQDTVFRCACGAEIATRSSKPEYKLEICSACHPFFTGKQKLVDSAGRVERFMKKYGDKPIATGKKPAKTTRKKAETAAKPARVAKAKPKEKAKEKTKEKAAPAKK